MDVTVSYLDSIMNPLVIRVCGISISMYSQGGKMMICIKTTITRDLLKRGSAKSILISYVSILVNRKTAHRKPCQLRAVFLWTVCAILRRGDSNQRRRSLRAWKHRLRVRRRLFRGSTIGWLASAADSFPGSQTH